MAVKPAVIVNGSYSGIVPDVGPPTLMADVQGRKDPVKTWGTHVITEFVVGAERYLYDPSYGTGPFFRHGVGIYSHPNGSLLHYNNSFAGFIDTKSKRMWTPNLSGFYLDIEISENLARP